MNSGDGSSVPKRRTRQQFLKYCVEFIEKRNKSTQNGKTTHSSTTCSVNIGDDDHVSCGRKTIKLEKQNTSCKGGEKLKMGKLSEDANMMRSLEKGKKRKISPGTCKSITKKAFIQEISDSDDDDNDDDPDVVIIGDVAVVNSGSGSGSWSNVGSVGLRSPALNVVEDVISTSSSKCRTRDPSEPCKTEEPIDVEKLEDFVDPLKSEQAFTDTTESEASSDED